MASRSRRRPRGRAARRPRRRLRFGWLIGGAAIVAVVAVVGLVIVQGAGSSDDSVVAAEEDDDPGLPGMFVDLPEIYGGSYPDTGGHVSEPIDYEAAGNSNPPVGGPHWNGNCGDDPNTAPPFCGPAPWGIFFDPWEPETLVHNMEHGGVVVWYNTEDDEIIGELAELLRPRLEEDDLIVMTPYADMEDEHIAITSWSRIDKFPVSEYDAERVNDFIDVHGRRFNPEHF